MEEGRPSETHEFHSVTPLEKIMFLVSTMRTSELAYDSSISKYELILNE